MHEVLVNRLGGLSLPRKSVIRLIDRPDMTLDVYRGRKTATQLSMFLSSVFLLGSGIWGWVGGDIHESLLTCSCSSEICIDFTVNPFSSGHL